jgi:putative nucleotidyltransferase with HDIG domain
VARAGHDVGYVDAVRASWSEKSPHGLGPSGRAIRERQPVVIRDIASDPSFIPWREAALDRGYGSLAVFPLRHEQTVLGVLCIYAVEPNAFDEAEIQLLTELAEDLAYGIRALRTGQAHEIVTQRHQDLLYATIRAIALTVEKRDPYTAGHQGRVAQLATAIARELGMEEERVEGIRLGALIHDIGKVYIPAEILTRPGKLSPIEFELVKSHPEVGREIVADIPFPWPVADMIYQHHERLDGSGYPQGLKGEAIIMEARILTVADMVEAIASHRPYRAALGMEHGMEVISAGRGTLFDPQVVDACIHLCREGGFTFASDDSI